MLRVGLTGGFATGKTFVAQELARLGCHVIHADELGRQVMEPEGAAFAAVIREFGGGILAGGRIDRKALALEVFGKPERLQKLNEIIHPLVFDLEEKRLREIQSRDPQAIAVIEAAILIETGAYKRCQKLILTVCTTEQQVSRAMARDGMPEAEVRARIRSQMPIDEKRKFADYIIDTSETPEATLEQTRAVYKSLRSLTP